MKRTLLLLFTLLSLAAMNTWAQVDNVSGLADSDGWYSDDTRNASGTDVVGLTLTHFGKPGQTPTSADDDAIRQQISFVVGPDNVGALKMDKNYAGGSWSKCTISKINTSGFAAGDSWLSGFFLNYRYYTNSTAELTVPKIGIQSTDWAASQASFTAIRSGEPAWDLVLVDWRGTNPTWTVNGWATFTTDANTECWRIYRQAGNGYFPATPAVNMSLQQIYSDVYWGPKIFGTGAKVVSFQLGVGSSAQTSISYIDYFQTNLLNNGNIIDFVGAIFNVTQNTSHATLNEAVSAATPSDLITVAAGTYLIDQQVVVDKNLTITGAGEGVTTLKANLNLTGASSTDPGMIKVNTDVTLDFSGFTLDGDYPTHQVRMALITYGTNGSIHDNTVKNFTVTGYDGRGIVVYGTNVTVTNNELFNIGRIGIMVRKAYYGSQVGSATVTGNLYTGKGTGDHLDYGIEIGAAANATISGNNISECKGVAYDNSTSAGILATDYYESGTIVTISSNTLHDNASGIAVGYDDPDATVATITGNTFTNNTENAIQCTPNIVIDLDATLTGNTFDRCAVVTNGVNIVPGTAFNTKIQDAIDQAVAGNTIKALAGTYTEQLHITTNNLTIEGAGKTSTIIKSPATLALSYTSSDVNKPVVFVDGVSTFTLKNAMVDGDGKGNLNYRFQGIGFYNSGGTLFNVDVLRVWDTPFSGNQHGVGVYSYSDAGGPFNITCKNMLIEDYQKNAMTLLGNAILDIDNVTTIGEGATGITAQNGIQVGPLTTGTIKNCTVQDVQWTGGGNWTASGMLLYGDVNVENTDISGCQTGVYPVDANNVLTHVDITAPTVVLDEAYGIIDCSSAAAREFADVPQPSPVDGIGWNPGRSSNMTLSLDQCKIIGNDESGSVGVYLYSLNSLTATIEKCKINNWEVGIYAYGDGTGTVNTTVHKTNLADNVYGFINIPGGTRADADAMDNWWGDESGPYDPIANPNGLGSEVSDNVIYTDWITDPVDINISNPSCGVLEVTCVPSMPLSGSVTNILFAVKWDYLAYPDVFQGVSSDYNVTLQYYYNDGTNGYAVFGTDATTIDWDALVGDVILTINLKQNQPEGTVSDFVIADDAWTLANNADYYFEFWGSDLTGLITGFADEVYLADCDLQLHAKVFLQGPYNTTTDLMDVSLTTVFPAVPFSQPFNAAPWNYSGTESISAIPADMVDWVLVELRPTPSGAPVRKAGLLFKDGTIRSHIDSFFDIYFTGDFMPNADYHVAVFARNHMPVMSQNLVNIPNAGSRFDFSNMTTYPSYGGATAQVLLEAGVHGMIAGDINGDGDLIYSGTANDRGLIIQKITAVTSNPYINGTIQGYYLEDLTMNSWVKYSGSGNDQRLIILNLIELTGTYNLNASYASLVPGWGTKAPHYNPGNGPIDIAIVENNTSIDVVLLTKENLGETWADNIQFTLSWDENNVMMDQVAFNYTGDFKIEPQGEVIISGGRKYMTYAVVDYLPLPVPFNAGDKVTVLSLNKGSWTGTSSKATIAQDGFTLTNNGDYYISLIGLDKTGQLLTAVTGIDDPVAATTALQLYPNPVTGGQVTLSVMPSQDEVLTLSITDVSSRVVYQQMIQVTNGMPLVKVIGLEGLANGTYLVRLQGAKTCQAGKIVVR